MSRPVSAAAKRAMFAQETEEAFLMLLTLDHDDLAVPIRVVNNSVDIPSRGENFIAFPFVVDLPSDGDDGVSQVTLQIDNVDREIVDSLRAISTAPTVTLEVVMGSTPDVVEAGPFDMTLVEADYDILVVRGLLVFEDILNEPYPAERFTPDKYPAL